MPISMPMQLLMEIEDLKAFKQEQILKTEKLEKKLVMFFLPVSFYLQITTLLFKCEPFIFDYVGVQVNMFHILVWLYPCIFRFLEEPSHCINIPFVYGGPKWSW